MIKKFIDRLLGAAGSSKKSRFGTRREIGPQEHGIDVNLVDERAANVVRVLKEAGYEAYIVGGAVRDLLLGLQPKDFDVATAATPEQVKSLFRRAFIIGRRFRIVHVVYGRGREHEVIEVSTFRAYLDSADAEQVAGNERTSKGELSGMKHAVDASGRVLRDNVWGPIEQDAARRDFSVNAMYYDPETQTVVDLRHGIRDAQKKQLRMIGDAAARYREDPVRIIRATRFAAKLAHLGFKLEAKTREPLQACLPLLHDVPQSRLFDEMLKLLQTGHALASVAQLKALGLGRGIYPLLDVIVQRADDPFVQLALQDTDRRVGEGKPVAPSFLLACVLWADVRRSWEQRLQSRPGHKPVPAFAALQDAIDEAFDSRIGDVSGRGKLGADMREIWLMQPRFDKRSGSGVFTLVEQARFRAGFDFLRLRAQVGEVDEELAHWWETFSTASDERRQDMVDAQRNAGKGAPKARRVKRGDPDHPAGAAPEAEADPRWRDPDADADADDGDDGSPDAAAPAAEGESAPAKKRRRRRRKPNGAARAEGGEGSPPGGGDAAP
jgi:poly(A) polymerase